MLDCLFCRIINGNIASNIVFEDEYCIVLNDLYPKAPVHLLIIPKEHIATIDDCSAQHTILLGHMIQIAKRQMRAHQLDQSGYRLVFNCKTHGGQEIYHIHLHAIGGKQL